MRIYFLSARPAALKLNGIYVGIIDHFERHVEMDCGENVLAEIIPDGNDQPINFFINGNFLEDPPEFADVYRMDGEALIHIKTYAKKNAPIQTIAQTRFCGNLITLFSQGGLYLSCEGKEFFYYELDENFRNAKFEEQTVGGYPLLFLKGDGCILAVSEEGKRVFANPAARFECGENLTITVPFETCAQAEAECVFSYDGREMKLEKSVTRERQTPPDGVLHFAFFESVLTRGNFADYLCDGLKPHAEKLFSYFGEFTGVTVPTEKFYAEHGRIMAAGLVYPVKKNLFDVKYFAVETENQKISNVTQVQ